MYRCTECKTEYTECPDFCDCGNDEFEEVYEEEQEIPQEEDNSVEDGYGEEELIPPPGPPKRKKRKMTNEEAVEYFQEQKEKKKSLIAAGVILVLCLIALFVLPPHQKAKMEAVKDKVAQANVKIPSVDTYWDDTLPSAFKKKDTLANLPVLNNHFREISPVLRDYLRDIGNEFDRKWDKTMIQAKDNKSFTTLVVFTVDKEGILNVKRIVNKSHNDSLDDSVSLALTNFNSFQIPPEDYKGEKIYIAFNCDEQGNTSIKYPQNANLK